MTCPNCNNEFNKSQGDGVRLCAACAAGLPACVTMNDEPKASEMKASDGESGAALGLPKTSEFESVEPIRFEWESYRTGPAYNPRYSGYHVGHYCTGNPELGWCLYSRGTGDCWNQRTEKLIPPVTGMEPRRINGAWFWVVPDDQASAASDAPLHDVSTASSLQPKHDPHCDCGICAYCNGQEDIWGNPPVHVCAHRIPKTMDCPDCPECVKWSPAVSSSAPAVADPPSADVEQEFDRAIARAETGYSAGWEVGRDAARFAVLEQRCERGTAWDAACVACAEAIRSLKRQKGIECGLCGQVGCEHMQPNYGHCPTCSKEAGRRTFHEPPACAVTVSDAPDSVWAEIKILCNYCGAHVPHTCTMFLKRDDVRPGSAAVARSFQEFLAEQMEDPEFKTAYEEISAEEDVKLAAAVAGPCPPCEDGDTAMELHSHDAVSETHESVWNRPVDLDVWPLPDVLTKLANWCEHLMLDHNCDEHGYEECSFLIPAARQHAARTQPVPAEDRIVQAVHQLAVLTEGATSEFDVAFRKFLRAEIFPVPAETVQGESGARYQQFLAEHDECDRCGNATCRGTEIFPFPNRESIQARCWNCLLHDAAISQAGKVGQLMNAAAVYERRLLRQAIEAIPTSAPWPAIMNIAPNKDGSPVERQRLIAEYRNDVLAALAEQPNQTEGEGKCWNK